MAQIRPGYHTATLQFPDAIWDALCQEAKQHPDKSVGRFLSMILAERYGLSLPLLLRPGRKPGKSGNHRPKKPARRKPG